MSNTLIITCDFGIFQFNNHYDGTLVLDSIKLNNHEYCNLSKLFLTKNCGDHTSDFFHQQTIRCANTQNSVIKEQDGYKFTINWYDELSILRIQAERVIPDSFQYDLFYQHKQDHTFQQCVM
jgi:hypothetical protein